MDNEHPTALRGFDSYEMKLGDELRGHRATLGKSLLDVQRELRIKASYIDAIENCDASVVPNKGFVPGYVRAYARYLGLDPEHVEAVAQVLSMDLDLVAFGNKQPPKSRMKG